MERYETNFAVQCSIYTGCHSVVMPCLNKLLHNLKTIPNNGNKEKEIKHFKAYCQKTYLFCLDLFLSF